MLNIIFPRGFFAVVCGVCGCLRLFAVVCGCLRCLCFLGRPTKGEKKVHKLPIILKKLIFFQILKKQKRRHIMASEASKKSIFGGKTV
jgi:hypothetical protein